ncbi:MAG: SDR family oxidoreductase [Alphaproteobacteria bacterium]|nr:SDR family oxidoreductase [Alphaproteobacteria bacterium]MCD8520350.1 SDR family oxidoreductase [Alphaproteobacteria bacterium]MCD8571726.1 SDR family oxidoreductase [Alphaproteobacteria bacterium]
MTTVQNKIVLITGANRGIGKAYAEEFLKAGARKIYLGTRDTANVKDMVAAHPNIYVPLKLDVTKEADVKAAAQTASDVQILINNAGIALMDGLDDAKAANNARQQFEVNYIGPLLITQAFAPVLKKNGGGTLITVSSIAGHVAFPAFMTYVASKFAVHSLILSSRALLAAQGTKVIGVYPGPIDTDMARDVPMDKFPPAMVAQETLKAIASGAEDVFTDPMAQGLYAALRADPKAVEKQMLEMVQQSQKAA